MTDGESGIRTFLIADVRGYSRFTDEFGDEAAAELAAKFADLASEGVEAHGGRLVELRGDEALAVFTSARQAIRAAVDLQARFGEETELHSAIPLRVGMGIDSGEAVQLEDGSFRGAALNVAARLCGRAHGGEVIVSEATSRLAGHLAGLQFSDRGRVRLKNIPDPIHIFQVYSELDAPPQKRWVFMIFGRPARSLGWGLGSLVVLVAAATAAVVVYLIADDHTEGGVAAPPSSQGGSQTGSNAPAPAPAGLASIVPRSLWQDCRLQAVPEPTASESAVCVPSNGMPDRWELSSYESGEALVAAYDAELRGHRELRRNRGRCNAFSWGGELEWLHGPLRPGGRAFCYFDGTDAVIVWSHEKLGQPSHRDVLAIAREGGSDHVALTRWWRVQHHVVGKAG